MSGKYRLKDAFTMAPMEECTYRHGSRQRDWWRYGWAMGFLESNLADCIAPVTRAPYRLAIKIGFDRGVKARRELDAAQASG